MVQMTMLLPPMVPLAVMAARAPLGCTCHVRLSCPVGRGEEMLLLSDNDTSQSCVMHSLPSAGQSVLLRLP